MAKILVCDDEQDIVSAIRIYLKSEGHEVLAAHSGEQAVATLEEAKVDLIIMDVMMPGMDGINATLTIRKMSDIPIIILSAKGEYEDRVLGLNVGADDYVVKPFNGMELMARVNSCLRRYGMATDKETSMEEAIYHHGRISLDDGAKEVFVDGDLVKLTPSEFNILKYFMQRPNQVLSSEQIYEGVWEEEAINVKKTISVHISHLRDKVEINPRQPELIKSVYGMGYKLEGGKRL